MTDFFQDPIYFLLLLCSSAWFQAWAVVSILIIVGWFAHKRIKSKIPKITRRQVVVARNAMTVFLCILTICTIIYLNDQEVAKEQKEEEQKARRRMNDPQFILNQYLLQTPIGIYDPKFNRTEDGKCVYFFAHYEINEKQSNFENLKKISHIVNASMLSISPNVFGDQRLAGVELIIIAVTVRTISKYGELGNDPILQGYMTRPIANRVNWKNINEDMVMRIMKEDSFYQWSPVAYRYLAEGIYSPNAEEQIGME